MQYRGVNELRRMFLDFFESKEHLKMKSFSLVPHNDNSLLIINSGMAVDAGFIEKGGAGWYTIGDKKLQGDEKLLAFLNQDKRELVFFPWRC